MSQHNLRRPLAAFAFAMMTTLSPLADLHAAPVRQGRSESREARVERRESFSMWKSLERLFEKLGPRIDGNGLTFATPVDDEKPSEKLGPRIDGNG